MSKTTLRNIAIIAALAAAVAFIPGGGVTVTLRTVSYTHLTLPTKA